MRGNSYGVILQVSGLGVPVQAPSQRNQKGFEIRWSSDPEIPRDCPAHLLIGEKEYTRFISLSVDSSYMKDDLIKAYPIALEAGETSMSKAKCVEAGISEENWNIVRIGLVISGNTEKGPVMDTIDWIGTRESYDQADHLREAFQHGKQRGMNSPSVFTHTEGGHVYQAAKFFDDIRKQMKPSLRTSDLIMTRMQEAVAQQDFTGIAPEKAVFYLINIKEAMERHQEQKRFELEDMGLITPPNAAHEDTAFHGDEPQQAPVSSTSGPSLH